MTIRHATLTFDRAYAASPARVFAAFADEQALLAWSSPGGGWTMRYNAFRFRVGEEDVCTFGPAGLPGYVNRSRYEAIVPGERIVYASTLTHEGIRTFAGTVAVELAPSAAGGTHLRLVETGFYLDGGDGPEGHEEGWSFMLDQLGTYLGMAQAA